MVPHGGDRIDGWWNQIPPLDSRSEPWSKCRTEKRFFQGRRKKTSPAARTVYVSLDRADAIIEGGAQIDPRDDSRVPHPFVFGFSLANLAKRRRAAALQKRANPNPLMSAGFTLKSSPTRQRPGSSRKRKQEALTKKRHRGAA